MVRIAIVDDERQCAEQAAQFVHRYFGGDKSKYKLSFFADGLEFIENYRAAFDVVLLDIEMPMLDGVETAKRLRQRDAQVILIYMTRMAQYAAWGYDVDAIGFLVKPIDYYSFELKMKKAERILQRRGSVTLVIPAGEGRQVLRSADILYIEVTGHEVAFHTALGVFRAWGSLAEYARKLSGAGFAAANRYCLVNLEHVRAASDQEIRVGEDSVPLSRSRKKEFMLKLTEFYGSR